MSTRVRDLREKITEIWRDYITWWWEQVVVYLILLMVIGIVAANILHAGGVI